MALKHISEAVERVIAEIPSEIPYRDYQTDFDPNGIRTTTHLHGVYGGDVATDEELRRHRDSLRAQRKE